MELTAHPHNQRALAYLAARRPASAVYLAPDAVADPYMGSGSHPDIVARVWKELAAKLPGDARALVHGTPALVHAPSGLILAAAIGTQYVLRLRAGDVALAVAAGAPVTTRWSSGETLDVREALGPEWIFGSFMKAEPEWVASCFAELDPIP